MSSFGNNEPFFFSIPEKKTNYFTLDTHKKQPNKVLVTLLS